jgi:hypothetical protein
MTAIGPDGFEPSPPDPKTGVLPLDDGPAVLLLSGSRCVFYAHMARNGHILDTSGVRDRPKCPFLIVFDQWQEILIEKVGIAHTRSKICTRNGLLNELGAHTGDPHRARPDPGAVLLRIKAPERTPHMAQEAR